jgi:L-ascorbate metabolism protein UlaG (beta-lactamase superfamily)
MKLTKYGHACVMIEGENGNRIIIDPGNFTDLPDYIENIEAVVITHMHADHTDVDNIQKIIVINPDVVVYGTSECMKLLDAIECEKVVVNADLTFQAIGVDVKLTHVPHAVIWESSPCSNLAVLVGDFYYYPGDSFHVVHDKVRIVGVPVSAPWLKMSESIEFAKSMKAELLMPTHDGLLNGNGQLIVNSYLDRTFTDSGKKLISLAVGESITL